MQDPLAIVLAAGKGTRMRSDLPKVLFPVCGRPMLHYVVQALHQAGIQRILVVVGYRADLVREALADQTQLEFIDQTEQKGTGHAVQVCLPRFRDHQGPVVIVTGDSPLLQPASLRALLDRFAGTRPACLLGTLHKPDPGRLGRIVRDAGGQFQAIVEARDATPEQLAVTEVNMSTYVFDGPELVHALGELKAENAQQEYYLTDCPGILKAEGKDVQALAALQPCEALSVNTVEELAVVEAEMKKMSL